MAYGKRKSRYDGSTTVYVHICVDADGVSQVKLSGDEYRPNAAIATPQFSAACNILNTVPKGKQLFDDNTKVWSIDNDYWNDVKVLFQKLPTIFKLVPYDNEDDFESFLEGRDRKKITWDGPENKAAQDFFRNFNTAISKIADDSHDKLTLAKLLSIPSFDNIPSDKQQRRSLYRAAAIKHHPDKNNGNGHNMSELNRLWGAYVQPTL